MTGFTDGWPRNQARGDAASLYGRSSAATGANQPDRDLGHVLGHRPEGFSWEGSPLDGYGIIVASHSLLLGVPAGNQPGPVAVGYEAKNTPELRALVPLDHHRDRLGRARLTTATVARRLSIGLGPAQHNNVGYSYYDYYFPGRLFSVVSKLGTRTFEPSGNGVSWTKPVGDRRATRCGNDRARWRRNVARRLSGPRADPRVCAAATLNFCVSNPPYRRNVSSSQLRRSASTSGRRTFRPNSAPQRVRRCGPCEVQHSSAVSRPYKRPAPAVARRGLVARLERVCVFERHQDRRPAGQRALSAD